MYPSVGFQEHSKIRVSNIPIGAKEDELADHFSMISGIDVNAINLSLDNISDPPRRTAYIPVRTFEDVQKAIRNYNYTLFQGAMIRVSLSLPASTCREGRTVLLRQVPEDKTSSDLYDLATAIGPIVSINIPRLNGGRSSNAFVDFLTPEDAQLACDTINGTKRSDSDMIAEIAPETRPCDTVFVRNIPPTWTDEDLERHFSKFGNVKRAVIEQKEPSSKYGFVSYEQPEEANKASKLSGVDFNNPDDDIYFRLYINLHRPKKERIGRLKPSKQEIRERTICIRGLPLDTVERSVEQLCQKYGIIRHITLWLNKGHASPKRCARVEYESPASAKYAVASLHDTSYRDSLLRVTWDAKSQRATE